MGRGAVFLDRDGTLNVDRDYVVRPEEWEWIPGAVEALEGFGRLGLKKIVISNQSGIGRGYYTREQVDVLHHHVNETLLHGPQKIDAFYYCPHAPEAGCACRKPAPGLILQAARDLGIDPASSFFVGDKAIDVEAAQRAGVTPLFVLTGHGAEERDKIPAGVPVFADILAVSQWILRRKSEP